MNVSGLLDFLAANVLSVDQYQVLEAIHYGPQPRDRLIAMAVGESKWGPLPSLSPQECGEALESLLARELLQVVDAAELARIQADLEAHPAYGPIKGLPSVGEIDFTAAGGRLWQRIDRVLDPNCEPWCGYGELNEEDETFRDESVGSTEPVVLHAAASEIEQVDLHPETLVSRTGPDFIGPWRVAWWDVVHPRGYRVVIIRRVELDPDQSEPDPEDRAAGES